MVAHLKLSTNGCWLSIWQHTLVSRFFSSYSGMFFLRVGQGGLTSGWRGAAPDCKTLAERS